MRRRTKQQLVTAAALFAAAAVGTIAAPYVHPTTSMEQPSPSSTVSAAKALRDLRTLGISDAYVPAPYDRAAFGQAWADTDHNGCDTRNDVLRRDLTAVVTKPGTNGCVVLSGTLHDPYTGRTIAFERGNTSSLAVQIDHRVPLSYAWRHGAASWTPQQRELFANDQATNLVAVDGPANEEKSDSGPAEWMPTNTGDACNYAASFVTVATKWQLSISTDDKHALARTLTTCS
ncbi:HNH endonuclease family protein [Curtobacterium flaccumfaciens pv. betae]|uniref:HNH endonuclease family protein n=1 Tax=Curtobacterium flaccumfaciens TaxID=2035 RepID=UPI00265B7236|nr:HNH endonuclease family protein [Curtobacterium flaccumfaciens]MCS5465667.1 HNH endonuclease family protein [Curtobacterium flaccumfaciens pv. betae]MCX2873639.1 HNH endonuclease family protein [Curtobacterium flaccumfaciens pv. betae]